MHPRNVLLGAQAGKHLLPVCDHYSGVEARMVKSLELQREYAQEFGVCVFDVTLDCEDGAPVGGELEHATMVATLVKSAGAAPKLIAGPAACRIGVRLHSTDHPAFEADVRTVVGTAAAGLSYVMIPKVESVSQVDRAIALIDAAMPDGVSLLPLHVLIESPLAVHRSFEIAAHPRVQSVSFGLMDFVSAHGGAIPSSAMSVGSAELDHAQDQFHHPLVVQAKVAV
ncbi:MAG: CoA ester lyase, partial [Burkholderiales bacterium PBB4]